MALSDEAKAIRAQMDAADTRKAVWRGDKPLHDSRLGARTLGTLAEIIPGCEVWTIPDARKNSHDEGVGGIVLEVVDKTTLYDEETGEITRRRAFKTYDYLAPWHLAFRTLEEELIHPESSEAGSPTRMANAVRRFCAEVARGKGMILPKEAGWVTDATRLAQTLMGGRW